MIAPRKGEVVYSVAARMAGLALVLLTVVFQRRGAIHWAEVVFLGLCVALQEFFLRLTALRRYRNVMLVVYSLLPLALIGLRAPDIVQHRGEFVPLILHTPLPLVFVSIQIMVLYLREAPRLTSVVLVLSLFSTVIGLRRNVGDATWPWLAAICCSAAAYLMLQHPGTIMAQLVHALAGRPTVQTHGARPSSAVRPAFLLALPVLVAATVVLALALFLGLPRPNLRGTGEVIAATPPAPPLLPSPPERAPGPGQGGPVTSPDASVSGLSNGVNLGVFGRIQLDGRTALTVRPLGSQPPRTGPLYLRAYTFAQFDGRRWAPLPDETQFREIPEGPRRALPFANDVGGPRWSQRGYEITLGEGAAGMKGELPLPVVPTGLFDVTGPLGVGLIDGAVRAPMQPAGASWRVQTAELAAGPAELAQELGGLRVNIAGVPREYLEVPAGLPALLAQRHGFYTELNPERGGAWGAARRIVENFHEKRGPDGKKLWRYSLSERPSGRSPLVRFLDTSTERAMRTGHCEYFAAAMVILLRCHGVPARLCAGFAARQSDEEGVYELKFSDAHAWVEVWIPPCGWVTFDPTPPAEAEESAAPAPQNVDDILAGGAGATDQAEPAPEAPPEPDWFQHYDAHMQDQWLAYIGAAFSGLGEWLDMATAWLPSIVPQNPWLRATLVAGPPAWLAVWLLYRRRRRSRAVQKLVGEAGKDGRRRELGLYAELLLLLQRHGHNKQPSETPLEFARRVAQLAPQHEPALGLTRLYYDFRFGLYEARIAEFRQQLAHYAARLRAPDGGPAR